MDNIETSFFHMAFGVVLFVVAVCWLVLDVKSIVMSAQVRQEDMADKVLYESGTADDNRIIMGDWLLLYVMTESEADIKIYFRDGTDLYIRRGKGLENELDILHKKITSSFVIEYEYEEDGRIKTTEFKER